MSTSPLVCEATKLDLDLPDQSIAHESGGKHLCLAEGVSAETDIMKSAASLPTLAGGASLRLRDSTQESRLSQTAVREALKSEVEKLLDWADASRHPNQPAGVPQDRYVPGPRSDVERWITHKASLPQLGPVRYQLAIESTPFGGQLPPESKVTGGKEARVPRESAAGQRRDISYLADSIAPQRRDKPRRSGGGGSSSSVAFGSSSAIGGGTPASAAQPSVPASLIPGPFHLMLEAPFPLSHVGLFGELSDSSWTKSTVSKLWQACVFPSAIPAGRRDVILLGEWMTEMLTRLSADRELGEEELVHEAQTIFSVCFHEVVRQVAVHCAERGHLMAKIWVSNMELFERLTQLMTNVKLQMVLQNEHVAAERQALLKRVAELESALETARAEQERLSLQSLQSLQHHVPLPAPEVVQVSVGQQQQAGEEEEGEEGARGQELAAADGAPRRVEGEQSEGSHPAAAATAAAAPAAVEEDEPIWPRALADAGEGGRTQWNREMEALAERLEGVAKANGFQGDDLVEVAVQTEADDTAAELVDDAAQTELSGPVEASAAADEPAVAEEGAAAGGAAPKERSKFDDLAVLYPEMSDALRAKPWKTFLPNKKLPKPKDEWSQAKVVNAIAQLLEDKVKNDRARDTPAPWAQYVFMWHMHTYGLKGLARDNLSKLLASTMALAPKNDRIRLFADVCGVGRERPFSERRIALVTKLLSQLFTGKEHAISEQLDADDTNDTLVPLVGDATRPGATAVLLGLDELQPRNAAVVEAVQAEAFTTDRKEKVVLVDTLLFTVVEAFEAQQRANRERMLQLFTQYDTNGDGVLSIEEFTALLKACDPTLSPAKCEDIFLVVQDKSEKLDAEVGDAILASAFVLVAEEYNLDTNPDD